MSELKPCPFCGCNKIRFVERFNIKGGSYDCVECGSSAGRKLTQEFALVAWNTRDESPELAALREQIKLLTQYLSEDGYDMLRIIATVKYLRGIAERGTGRLCDDNETTEQFVLGYVKKLEGQVKVLREALTRIYDATGEEDENDGNWWWFNEVANTALEQTKPKGGE